MGFGDALMLTGIARRTNAMTNQRVCPVDVKWQPYWDSMFDGLFYMTKQFTADVSPLRNGPSVRQYYWGMDGNRIIWRTWDKAPGEIALTLEEREWARAQFAIGEDHPKFLVINTSWKAKGGGGVNKDWGIDNWKQVGAALDDTLLVQMTEPWLPGTLRIETPTFRHACAILERSIGYVGHEGGLHHAAAALGKPGVVVFGGFISPEVTGYPDHTNLYVPDERYPLGCGYVTPCEHCRESMSKITVEQVVTAAKKMIDPTATFGVSGF